MKINKLLCGTDDMGYSQNSGLIVLEVSSA